MQSPEILLQCVSDYFKLAEPLKPRNSVDVRCYFMFARWRTTKGEKERTVSIMGTKNQFDFGLFKGAAEAAAVYPDTQMACLELSQNKGTVTFFFVTSDGHLQFGCDVKVDSEQEVHDLLDRVLVRKQE